MPEGRFEENPNAFVALLSRIGTRMGFNVEVAPVQTILKAL